MAQKSPVPFFSNTEDNNHCFQAALRIVLGYFQPNNTYDWDELDRLTAHTANYTWPAAGLLHCVSVGLEIVLIDDFDYDRFSAEGYDYLLDVSGKEVADVQRKNSNLEQEMEFVKRLKSAVRAEKRIPLREDLIQLVDEGALVICNVNSRLLAEQEGYSGHFVVVTGIENDGIRLHDPGLPPRENAIESWARFEKAWSYPDQKARNIMAFKPGRS
jgi:YD repeat-containing protein